MTNINLSDAKDKLSQLVKEAAETTRPITISVHGRQEVVLIAVEEYQGLLHTIEILKNQVWVRRIQSSLEDFKNGKCRSFEQIRSNGHSKP